MQPELIYCADGNPRFAQIAIDAGFTYGAQLPNTVYHRPNFVDQKWRKPDFVKYMAALNKFRPKLATVLDLENWQQLARVIWWAINVEQFVEVVIIIPKIHNVIPFLPRSIRGKEIRLGYSVPTKFGGTPVALREFIGWPVHLLGGRPEKQKYLSSFLNVKSADGNYAGLKARKFCQYFDGERWIPDGRKTEYDAPYRAFEISCRNIVSMWQESIDLISRPAGSRDGTT